MILYYTNYTGEIDVAWKFEKETDLEKWVTTADSDHNEGHSKVSLDISNAGHCLFHGHLESKLPKDGKIKRSGYCNMKSLRARVSKGINICLLQLKPNAFFF